MRRQIFKKLLFLIAIAAASGSSLVCAQNSAESQQNETEEPSSAWRLGAAIGYGERSNPLVLSDDIRIMIDLDIAWFGERWFFDNGDVGFTLANTDQLTLNLVGRVNSDRVFFGKTNSQVVTLSSPSGQPVIQAVSVPGRSYAGELGFELLTDGRLGFLQLAAHHDVSGTHQGYEIYANAGTSFVRQRWRFVPSFGASWKSDKLNDYYWGISRDEANLVFSEYHAGAGLNFHARLHSTYQISEHLAFVAVAEFERLNSETAGSPLVDERYVRGVFAGFRYGF